MSITYFGYTSAGSLNGDYGMQLVVRNKNYVTGFTCPGSGSQTVMEISAYTRAVMGAPMQRLAIYSSSHVLLCEGSTYNVLFSTEGWQGHLTQSSMTPNPCTLTGGVQYDLAFAYEGDSSNQFRLWYDSYSSGASTVWFEGYAVDGYPTPLADGTDDSAMGGLRVGVEAVAVATELLEPGHFPDTFWPKGFWAQNFYPEASQGGHPPLNADPGSFAITGTAASLERHTTVVAATTSFGITGTATTLKHNKKIVPATTAFSVTGTAAILNRTWKLAAGGTSFSVGGAAATLKHIKKIVRTPSGSA